MCMAAWRHRPITRRSLSDQCFYAQSAVFFLLIFNFAVISREYAFFILYSGRVFVFPFFCSSYLFLRSSFKVLSSWDVKLCRLCSWHEREFPPKELLFPFFFFLFSSGEKFIKSCWSRFPLVQEWKLIFFFPTHITSIYDSETRMSLSNTGWLYACFGSRSCYLHKDCPPCMGRRYHIRSRFAGRMQTLKKKKKKTSCSLLFVHSSGIFKIYFHVIRTRISYFHISFFKVIGWPAKFVVATNQFVWCLSYLFILIVSEGKNSLRAGGWYW